MQTYKKELINHYDLLIEEGNDPVYDSQPLKEYMDKWDGEAFIEDLALDLTKTVLEIGVGTGRLAVRVAPLCKEFTGIDISPKTAERANENLSGFINVKIICADFLKYPSDSKYDVIYSSLSFMHICDKRKAIEKVRTMLRDGGRFVLSVDKSYADVVDYGNRKLIVFPDQLNIISQIITEAGMDILKQYETELAYIFVARKIS